MTDAAEHGDQGDQGADHESHEANPPSLDTVLTRPGDSDWLLTDLIDYANAGYSIAITLTIGGTIVTGMLIGGSRWIDEFASVMHRGLSEGSTADAADQVRDGFLAYKVMYESPLIDTQTGPSFIHLRNARLVAPGGMVPRGEGTYWRGRLSQISGWNLGEMVAP